MLSSGTLNLKFMQRAAARNAQNNTPTRPTSSSPSTPANATSTPTAGPSKLSSTPVADATASPAPTDTPQALTSEQWFMPPRAAGAGPSSAAGKAKSATTSNWTFENSYMPFLGRQAASDSDQDEYKGTPVTHSGGGRIQFGFGEALVETADGDGEEQSTEKEKQSGKGGRSRISGHDEAQTVKETVSPDSSRTQRLEEKRTFIRPGGFDEQDDRVKNGQSSKSASLLHPSPVETNEASASTPKKGKKRKNPPASDELSSAVPKSEPPQSASVPAQSSAGEVQSQSKKHKAQPMTLDEREQQKKAEKKRKKKQAKLAKAAGGNASGSRGS